MEKIKNFVKEHKMLVAISALVVVIAIVVAILLLTSNEDKLPTSGSDVTVDSSTEDNSSESEDDYLSGIGTAPDNSESNSTENSSDIIDFPDDSESDTDVESSTSTPDEDTEVDNSESTTTEPDEDDNSEDNNSESSEQPVVPDDGDDNSEESTTPVEPEPTPSTVPSVSWTGPGLVLDNLDLTIPTLSHYNSEALTDNTNNTFWTGSSDSVEPAQQLYDTLNAVRDALIAKGVLNSVTGQSFALEQYKCSFSYSSYSSTMGLELYRNPLDGTYTLNINYPLDTFVVGVNELAPYNQSVLKVLISMFSSDVNEVYSYIMKGLYEDSSILNTSKYKTVGDCKIKFGSESYITEDNTYHIVFYIKGN